LTALVKQGGLKSTLPTPPARQSARRVVAPERQRHEGDEPNRAPQKRPEVPLQVKREADRFDCMGEGIEGTDVAQDGR
jgi:hypothetical protein